MNRNFIGAIALLVPWATQAQGRSVRDSTAVLVKQLAVQHAQFTASHAIGDFTGNKAPFDALFALYEKAGEPVLFALTDCFTDSRKTSLRYQGKPLSRGGLCYLMVHNLVYHEDDDDNWPGNYFGSLSPKRLLAAQRAWRETIRRHAYNSA
jgi:hypothetical protein